MRFAAARRWGRWLGSLPVGSVALLLGTGCIDMALPPLGPSAPVCSDAMRAGFLDSTPGTERRDLWVAFVDVGHGDSTWIRGPGTIGVDASEVLIDAGDDGRPLAPHVPDGGQAVVDLMLRAGLLPGTLLDAVVITHPDKDHYGGAATLLSRYPARLVMYGGQAPDAPTWARLVERAREAGAELRAAPRQLEAVSPLPLGPVRPTIRLVFADPEAVDDNDASLVLELSFRGRTILLMGDAGSAVEHRLLDRVQPVAVLRTGHHGGAHTSSQALLERVAGGGSHAIVSAGQRAGLPASAVIDRLGQSFGGRVWRTDRGDETLTRRAAAGDDHIIVRVAEDDGQVEICFLDPDPLAGRGGDDP